MGGLLTYSARDFPELAKSTASQVAAGLLFYLYRSRNAWHSTRVNHYFSGCMHTTLASAKSQAESLRGQGSVFIIEEQPVLVFRSQHGVLLVTQINTMQPLSSYSADAVRDVPQGVTKIDGALDNYMRAGAPIEGVVRSFDRTSRFWKTPPPFRNSVIMVASRAPDEEIAPLRKRQLKRWRSQACGTQYQLDWFEGVHSMKAAALNQLAAGPV